MTTPATPNPNVPKKRRPRGPNKSAGEKLAALTDKRLVDWLKNGVQQPTGAFDASGQPLFVQKEASAAHMKCVLQRLQQIRAGVFAHGKDAKTLADVARERGIGAGRRAAPPINFDEARQRLSQGGSG